MHKHTNIHTNTFKRITGSNKVMEEKGRQRLKVKLLAEIIRNLDKIIMTDFLNLLLQKFTPANHLLRANARI